MSGEAIISVSAAVVALVQLIKWSGMIPDKFGPLAVLVLSALGVAVWVYSEGTFTRSGVFQLFAGWIAVSTSAAGVCGFVRAAHASGVTATSGKPAGAGQHPVIKDNQ